MGSGCVKKQVEGSGDELYECYHRFLKANDLESCYEIMPHLAVAKEKRLLPIFRDYLCSEQRDHQLLAVCALGALGQEEAVPWLLDMFTCPNLFRGPGCRILQANILHAIGEIGCDSATEHLCKLFDLQIHRDGFRRKRRVIIIEALSSLAQQGGKRALQALIDYLDDPDFLIRANAITGIATSFWHRPNELSDTLFERLLSKFKDTDLFVQYSLISALETLSDLGCRQACELFDAD